MRRLLIVLAVAGSLCLLLPAAAAGARPVYEITAITITSTGVHGTSWDGEAVCGWDAVVAYTATSHRATEVVIRSQDLEKVDMAQGWCPLQADGDTTFTGFEQVMYGDQWRWEAALGGHGFRDVSLRVFTNTYTFTSHTCPPAGTVLATYP